MKTLLLLLISITSIQTSIAQTVTIPDSNFEQALIDLGYDTNGMTGDILQIDAEAVTNISVSRKNISSLVGIEGFINITTIICSNNNLTRLNIQSNSALQILDCSNNNLCNIDLSNNPELTSLNATLNQLTSIDVSNNTLLKTLNAPYNQVVSLDLSNNTALEGLAVFNNELISLNVSNNNNTSIINFYAYDNPNLTCIEVDNASYSINNWTNIDTQTSYTENCNGPTIAIPDVIFEQILIDFRHDTNGIFGNILPSEAEALTSLYLISPAISDGCGLESLFSGGNSLGSIDVSNNPLLEELNCSSCELSNIDVSYNLNLAELEFYKIQLATINISNNLELELIDLSATK